MQISFVLESWRETVDKSKISADNIRESFHYSAKIKDSFQQVEELCRPYKKRCIHLCRRLSISESASYEGSGEIQ